MILANYWTSVSDPGINQMIDSAVSGMQSLMIGELFIFLLCVAILFNVASNSIKKKTLTYDPAEVIRNVFLIILLSTYSGWIGYVDKIVDGVMISYETSEIGWDATKEVMKMQNIITSKEIYPDLKAKDWQEIIPQLEGTHKDQLIVKNYITDNISSNDWNLDFTKDVTAAYNLILVKLSLFGLSAAMHTAMVIVKMVYMRLIFAVLAILKVLGPLAITLSLLFPSSLKKWFTTYIMTKFTVLSCLVVEVLNQGYTGLMLAKSYELFGASSTAVSVPSLMLSYISILAVNAVCYLMAFWLTSRYIGDSGAGAFMSAAGTLATAGVNKGVQMASKVGGPGKGGGGSGSDSGSSSGGGSTQEPINPKDR